MSPASQSKGKCFPLLSLLFAFAAASFAQPYDGLILPFRQVTIGSPVEARVDKLFVREGDQVESGQLLVRLYSEMERLEAKRAEAAVEKREFEYKSSKNLFDEKVISEDEALESRIELDLAKLTHAMAEERVALRQLKAPISGVVVERIREEGEMVRQSEPVLVLVNIEQVYVQFYVNAKDLAEVRFGRKAAIRIPTLAIQEPVVGEIDFIDPRVDAASGLLRVRVKLDNPSGEIKAGVRATVELLPEAQE
ncbi:MAG: efflux RND transporter periplasmic adaptor subunit [Verrucomicrobiota bacterium]